MTEEKRGPGRPPKVSSAGEKELDKVQEQFDAFDNQVKELTLDRMNKAPKEEVEQQTKLSSKDLEKSKDIYLKPIRAIGPGTCPKTGFKEKFNEKFRADWEFAKEYVHFTAENHEIIGEAIELWTKPFPGVNCEWWRVPVNKPVWGPRYLAEQIKRCSYHRLRTEDGMQTGSDGFGKYHGTLIVDTTVQRLDAIPVSNRKSVFMGAGGF